MTQPTMQYMGRPALAGLVAAGPRRQRLPSGEVLSARVPRKLHCPPALQQRQHLLADALDLFQHGAALDEEEI
jgi:hypothetical protein